MKAFPLIGSSWFESAQGMFNSSVQSWCPHIPQHLLPSKRFPGKPSQHEGCFPASPGASKLPFPLASPSCQRKGISHSANLLGMSAAGCKPRFSDLRRFQRPQFVELLHGYLMVTFLGHLEAKSEGVGPPVVPIRGHASPRWGGVLRAGGCL